MIHALLRLKVHCVHAEDRGQHDNDNSADRDTKQQNQCRLQRTDEPRHVIANAGVKGFGQLFQYRAGASGFFPDGDQLVQQYRKHAGFFQGDAESRAATDVLFYDLKVMDEFLVADDFTGHAQAANEGNAGTQQGAERTGKYRDIPMQ